MGHMSKQFASENLLFVTLMIQWQNYLLDLNLINYNYERAKIRGSIQNSEFAVVRSRSVTVDQDQLKQNTKSNCNFNFQPSHTSDTIDTTDTQLQWQQSQLILHNRNYNCNRSNININNNYCNYDSNCRDRLGTDMLVRGSSTRSNCSVTNTSGYDQSSQNCNVAIIPSTGISGINGDNGDNVDHDNVNMNMNMNSNGNNNHDATIEYNIQRSTVTPTSKDVGSANGMRFPIEVSKDGNQQVTTSASFGGSSASASLTNLTTDTNHTANNINIIYNNSKYKTKHETNSNTVFSKFKCARDNEIGEKNTIASNKDDTYHSNHSSNSNYNSNYNYAYPIGILINSNLQSKKKATDYQIDDVSRHRGHKLLLTEKIKLPSTVPLSPIMNHLQVLITNMKTCTKNKNQLRIY